MPAGTLLNNTGTASRDQTVNSDEIGVDTVADETDNPATIRHKFIYGTGSNSLGHTAIIYSIVLTKGTLSSAVSGVTSNITTNTSVNFNTDNSIPVFTATGSQQFPGTGVLWTSSASGSADKTASVISSTTAGGTGSALRMRVEDNGHSTSGTIDVTMSDATDNKHKWFRYAISGSASGGPDLKFQLKLESADSFTDVYSVSLNGSSTGTIYGNILFVALGSGAYDVYAGGKKIISNNTPGTLAPVFRVSGIFGVSEIGSIDVYIDDVRESKYTVS